ncbi:hypothetical protein FRC07_000588 [Ceratobasidium sp. 392]|nr:hypothetical protein FRC07_000588 [Ceratobasidium sp. 392]
MSIATLSPLSLCVAASDGTTKSGFSSVSNGSVGLPKLMTMSGATTSLDLPRVTAVTVQAYKSSVRILSRFCAPKQSEISVYQTLDSTTRFAIIVPLSASKAYEASTEQNINVNVLDNPPRPKRGATVQRLGMQTPSPAWAIDYMSTRGGGRFSRMNRAKIHLPTSKRLALQEMESKDRIAAAAGPEPACQGSRTKRTRDNEVASEQFTTFKRLVAERTRPRCLESMGPLRLAVHNNLTRSIAISSNSGCSVGRNPAEKASKSKGGHRMRRMTPNIAPLDTGVTRAYMPVEPGMDSPPESPGPVTPVDEATNKDSCIAKDRPMVSTKSSQGAAHQVHLKGRAKAWMSRRF